MATGAGSLHDAPGTIWENWCDTEGVGTSKNHPAFAGGIGSFMYELAGLAEEGDCSTGLVLRPLRGTLRQLGSAHLELEVPQGRLELTWRYVESTSGVWQKVEANPASSKGEAGLSWRYVESQELLWLLRDEYSREFEVNVSLPFQLPHPTLLHIPIPSSPGKEGEQTAAGAASTSTVLLRERGCDCVIWSSDERLMEPGKVAGLVSVKLVLSPLARRMKSTPDTVVVELMGGDWGFHVGIPA